jgi:hypothetical protein
VPDTPSGQNILPDFTFNEVLQPGVRPAVRPAVVVPVLAPNLGPLAAFVGTWSGRGLNTIFRPDNSKTPTHFVPPIASDNVLELNLTQETLSFSAPLGNIPNRGSGSQGDIFLNGVPYLQTINDVTSQPPTGIHFEPGIWLSVPVTSNPNEPQTVARMASIPHGTTIVAQGVVLGSINGKPQIAAVDITPFAGGNPPNTIIFPSQTANNKTTPRIPQDLTAFIAAGTIIQGILDDPNTVLREQIQGQTITETITIGISTDVAAPLFRGPLPGAANPANPPPAIKPDFGGGTPNIAFLQGIPNPPPTGQGPNAQTLQMDAVFWIETVQYKVDVPPLPAGSPPIVLNPVQTNPPTPLRPTFVASIPFLPNKGFAGGVVTIGSPQIQYSQKVILNFNGLSWPHVSVASLVPAGPIPIPANLLPLT